MINAGIIENIRRIVETRKVSSIDLPADTRRFVCGTPTKSIPTVILSMSFNGSYAAR